MVSDTSSFRIYYYVKGLPTTLEEYVYGLKRNHIKGCELHRLQTINIGNAVASVCALMLSTVHLRYQHT